MLNQSIASTSLALIGALQWIASQKTIDVVNLSLGTANPEYGLRILQLVDDLYARGIPVVASRGYSSQPDYPAAFGSAISVSSMPFRDDNQLSFQANNIVEFGARGEDIEVPWKGAIRSIVSGSSFAAPLVAARVARLKQIDPRLRIWEIKTLLQYQAEG